MSDQKAKRFTIDDDKTGAKVPEINELLYAKTAGKSKGSNNQESLDPTVSLDISRANLEEITRQSDVAIAPPRKSTKPVEAIIPDNTALQSPGEIDLGDMDASLAIEAGTVAAPPAPPSPPPVIELATPKKPPSKFAPPATGEIVVSQFQKSASAPQGTPTGAPKAAIRKASPSDSPGEKLKHFDQASLAQPNTQASYASGVRTLFERAKAMSVIVFQKTESGFTASEVIGTATRANLWRGMEIPAKDLGDLMNRLNKYGYSEFSTLGMSGAGNFERVGFRTAFGVDRSEFLTLVKIGAGKDMDGVIAVFSPQSITTQIPFFHTALMGGTAGMKKAA